MKKPNQTLLAGLMLASLAIGSAQGATLVFRDSYDVINSGNGFNLNAGVNSGINPPTTRLEGSAAAGVRYIKAEGSRNNNLHYITNSPVGSAPGKLFIGYGGASTRPALTNINGGGYVDFGAPLFSSAATPSVPSVYELQIDMANFGTNRFGFGISTADGAPQVWDFGIELHRVTDTEPLSLYKRIDSISAGVGTDVNTLITNDIGAAGETLTFLFRITDAGAEQVDFSSRIELALVKGGTTNWIYDTQADVTDLPYGWRFRGTSRFLFYHVAGNAGPVTADNLSLTWYSGPTRGPIVQTWTGAGADDNWSTAANWGGVPLGNGDFLVFGAAARQLNNNDVLSLLVPSVEFTTGGFQLGGNELKVFRALTNNAGSNTITLPLTWTSTGSKTWNLAAGTTLALPTTVAIDMNGDHTLLGGGTMKVTGSFQIGSASTANPPFLVGDGRFLLDGAQFSTRGGVRIGSSMPIVPSVAELAVSNAANVNLTLEGAACRVGSTSNGVINRLIIDHSTWTMNGGDLGVPWVNGATGEVTQVAGIVSGCDLNFNQSGAGTGSYSVRDGVFEPRQIARNTEGGYSTISFDNATLRTYVVVNHPFMAALDVAEIKSGGLTLDITTADVTLASSFSGPGALTKSGPNSATLTGTNTYAGNTIVQAGKLVLPTTQTNAAAIQVADGAQLGVLATAQGTTLTASSLSIAGAASTLSFDLATFSPTTPLAQVGTVSVGGNVTVNLSGGSLAMSPGTITLLKYSTLSGTPTFSLGTLPAHLAATLVSNPGSLDLVVTAVKGYRWTGANGGSWDLSTVNWISLLDNTASTYTDGFNTEFRDGAATGTVDLGGGTVSPALLVVSNQNLAYTFTGGAITTPLLQKNGTGALTRVDGSLDQIGQIELNAGSYVALASVDADFALTLTDASAGLGTFVKQGAGILTVLSTNTTYDGAVAIQEGTLRLGTNSALGSTEGSTTIANGASLDVANVQAPHEPVFVSGEGVGGQGAIVNNTSGGGVQNNLTDVTMTGDTTFGCIAGSRWDIRVRTATGPGPGLRGNGYNVTKVGGGTLAISSQRHNYGPGVDVPYWHMNLGHVWVKEGTLAIEEAVSLDNPEKSLVVMPGATLNFFGLGPTNPIVRTITVTNASITCGGSTHTNILDGPVAADGSLSLRPNSAFMFVNGGISGNASVTIGANPNPGTVYFNAANTFTGDTTVTNSTLGGTGSIAGNLVMVAGGLAPGVSVGTLSVVGNATLAGTTTMELAPGQSPNSDMLSVGGSITGGGSLVVTLVAGASAPSAGEVFQLFNKGVTGFTNITLPDLSAYPGLSWNTNNLAINGSITVVGTAPEIATVTISGAGVFTMSGTGGTQGATYYIVSSPVVTAPMETWLPVETNVFGSGGTFSFSTNIVGGAPESFFRLKLP